MTNRIMECLIKFFEKQNIWVQYVVKYISYYSGFIDLTFCYTLFRITCLYLYVVIVFSSDVQRLFIDLDVY